MKVLVRVGSLDPRVRVFVPDPQEAPGVRWVAIRSGTYGVRGGGHYAPVRDWLSPEGATRLAGFRIVRVRKRRVGL